MTDINEELVKYLDLPRHELVSLFGPEWQEEGRRATDKLTAEERIALIPYIKPYVNKVESVQDMVIEDMKKRKELGLRQYGTLLFPYNGRNQLQDLYEELLDACCYVKAKMEEENNKEDKVLRVLNPDKDSYYAKG